MRESHIVYRSISHAWLANQDMQFLNRTTRKFDSISTKNKIMLRIIATFRNRRIVFGNLRYCLEIIGSSSEIQVLCKRKSHSFDSGKAGSYKRVSLTLTPWGSFFHSPQPSTVFLIQNGGIFRACSPKIRLHCRKTTGGLGTTDHVLVTHLPRGPSYRITRTSPALIWWRNKTTKWTLAVLSSKY